MILGVKDLLVQEVDPEQPLLWAQRVWMDCLGSLVFREPQEEMEHQGYLGQRGSLALERMERLVRRVREVYQDR